MDIDPLAAQAAPAVVVIGEGWVKFQPPQIGPITFGGLLALPFVVAAKMRGKCK